MQLHHCRVGAKLCPEGTVKMNRLLASTHTRRRSLSDLEEGVASKDFS
ncbi:unnamed protein product [Anisakis simplex]|uniref:Uncharacterized protein n=1 Tax=Anisakis simplex TaxID=6269 RepID=A0A0M3KF96_ANISI|nr:unnamed protein product [Anisakis simplex]